MIHRTISKASLRTMRNFWSRCVCFGITVIALEGKLIFSCRCKQKQAAINQTFGDWNKTRQKEYYEYIKIMQGGVDR